MPSGPLAAEAKSSSLGAERIVLVLAMRETRTSPLWNGLNVPNSTSPSVKEKSPPAVLNSNRVSADVPVSSTTSEPSFSGISS
ncbi:MAG: hypothetical protein HQ581_13355 [Planctomycetes bacterium]|nr:hypothetical protein [Planctomycetota bacterium]